MLKSLFTTILLFSITIVRSQTMSVSPNQLNFGVVNELTTDSQMVTINNTSGKQLTVTAYRFYTTYGTNAFTTSAGTLTIPDNSSQSFWVQFHPRHNIYHNSELIILNDGERGPLRVDLLGQGHYSNAYYDSTENQAEENLKTVLHSITGTGYVSLGYSPGGTPPTCARDTMFMVLDNQMVNGQGATQNTIECVYTGRLAVGYIDRTDCQNTATYNFNTEHTWPQSLFNSAEPMKSDLYHLFPTDNTANNIRANYPFGVVTTPTWTNGGSKYANGIFEPRDVHKGEVARAMIYFAIRYQNYSNFLDTQEAILRQWLTQFPATTVEYTRANHIALIQFNRNPFIDYPQFLERITSVSNTSVAPVVDQLDFPVDTINYGLLDATIPAVYHYWVVNKGNQVDTLTTYTLSPVNNLTFANGSAVPTILYPGEAKNIDVQLANGAPGNFIGNLNYTVSSSTGLANINVPIRAQLSLTGIDNPASKNNTITIYPNPVTDKIYISPAPNKETIVHLIDLQGRIIAMDEMRNGDNYFSVPATLNSGIYLLEITENNIPVRKLIVKE